MTQIPDDEWSAEDVPPIAVVMTILGVVVLGVIGVLLMIML